MVAMKESDLCMADTFDAYDKLVGEWLLKPGIAESVDKQVWITDQSIDTIVTDLFLTFYVVVSNDYCAHRWYAMQQ